MLPIYFELFLSQTSDFFYILVVIAIDPVYISSAVNLIALLDLQSHDSKLLPKQSIFKLSLISELSWLKLLY